MTADQIRSLQSALAALLGVFRPCFKPRVPCPFQGWGTDSGTVQS